MPKWAKKPLLKKSNIRILRQYSSLYPFKAQACIPRSLLPPPSHRSEPNNLNSGRESLFVAIWERIAAKKEKSQTESRVRPLLPSLDFQDLHLQKAKFCLVRVKEFNQREHVEAVIKVYFLRAWIINFRNGYRFANWKWERERGREMLQHMRRYFRV